jgi:hypothetical protein
VRGGILPLRRIPTAGAIARFGYSSSGRLDDERQDQQVQDGGASGRADQEQFVREFSAFVAENDPA